MAKILGMIEQVKRTKVALKDIRTFVEATESDPPEDRSFEHTIMRLVELFPGTKNADKRMAISFRMTALALLLENGTNDGISFIKRSDGSVSLNDSIFAAVAESPLIENDNQLIFDPADLFRRAREHESHEKRC